MLFLMLASVIMSADDKESEDLNANLLSCWIQDLMFWLVCLLNRWKEKQLEKVSMILLPGENSGLRGSKDSLKQLSILTTWSLMSSH